MAALAQVSAGQQTLRWIRKSRRYQDLLLLYQDYTLIVVLSEPYGCEGSRRSTTNDGGILEDDAVASITVHKYICYGLSTEDGSRTTKKQ